MTTDGADQLNPPTLDGEPALFLVESLIHEFVAREIIDRAQAAEIVTLALEAQVSSCDDRNEDSRTSPAVAALARIRATLAIDGVGDSADDGPMVDGTAADAALDGDGHDSLGSKPPIREG